MKKYLHVLIAAFSLLLVNQLQAQCPVPANFTVKSTKDVTCYGGSDGEIVITAAGSVNTSQFNFLLRDILEVGTPIVTQPFGSVTVTLSGQDIIFQGLSASSYIMQVTRKSPACNINVFSGIDINQPNELIVSTTSQTNITGCFGDATGAFTLAAVGGNGGYEYSKDGVAYQPSSTFNGLTAGSYIVYVRDSKGCTDTTTVDLTQPPLLQLTLDSQADPLCNGNANGSINVIPTGGTAPYTFSIDGVTFSNTTGSFTGLAAGTYEITVKDNKGCIAKVSNIDLIEPPVLTINLDSKTDILGCFGDNTGVINVLAAGGTPGYTYSVNGGPFTAGTGSFTGLGAGSYTISVRDANNCTVTLPAVTLSQPAQLTLAIQAQTNVLGCFGDNTGEVTVAAAGGQPVYEYSIDNGATFQTSATFSNLPANSYTVQVRDSKGCTATIPVTITQPTQVAASTAFTNPLCNGNANGTITVTATGGQPGYTYSINGGAFQTSNVFSGLTVGTYTIKVQDSKNCEITLPDVILTEPAVLTLAIGSQQDVQNCFGDASGSITVAAAGGTTAYQYSIDGGSTFQPSATFSGLTAGSYTILVRDANNCTTTVSTTINQPPVLALSLSSQTNILGCFGDATGSITVAATGGTPGYQYSRDGSTFQASPTFNGLVAGSYTITVRDSKNCTTTVAVTLTQPTQLTASLAAQTNILCFGQSTGSVTVNATGGTGTLSYSIDGSTFGASGTFNGLTAGSYTVTVRDANGCTTTVPATLTQPTQLAGSIAAQQNISCNGGTNGTITVSATGGTAPYMFSRDGITFVSNSGSFTGLTAGSYTISVRDANNCTATIGSVTLTEPTALQLTVSATTNVNCNGGSTGSVTVSATGGSSGYQYSINGGPFQASATFSGLTAGSYTITVRDANSCTTTVAATITQPAALVVNTATTNVTCNGGTDGSATATVSGGSGAYTYSWNTSPVQTTATATGLVAGTYIVTVTDANGCQQTASVTIIQPAVVAAPTASNPAAICTGGVIPTLTATGTNIKWYSDAALTTQVGTGNSFTPSISNATAGSFVFYATQTTGSCQSAATAVTITINPSPATPTISGTLTFCAGSNTILTSSSATGNQWLLNGSPIAGATNQTLTVSTAGNYTVQVTSGSCSATSAVATVTQTTVPTPTIAGALTFCPGGNTTLTSSANTGNQWLLNGSPIAGATNQTLTVTAAGNYSVTVTVSGCSATSAVATVTQTTVTAPVASNPAAICTGGVIPTLTATGTNIKWYSDAALTTQVGTGNSFTPSINNAVAGNIIFYATQTSGSCESAATAVTITINASPAKPTISGTLAFCSGSNTTLTSSAVSGNQWLLNGSPIAGATNPTLVVSAAGNYSVQVTVSGCSATSDPVAVTVTSASAPVASNPAAICVGGTVPTLTATGTNLQWYSDAALTTLVGTGSPFTPTVNTAVAGNTIFYVTQTVSGCPSAAAQVTVTVNPAPAKPTISGTLTFCTSGNTVLTSSATTGNQWLFNGTTLTGETNQTLSVATAGNYSVVVTTGGCSVTSDPVAVTETTPVTPTISGTLTFCPGDNTILTSSATSGNQWLLNGSPIAGATNQTLTVTAPGNYSVTVTTGGCSLTSAAVSVTQGAPAAPTASNPAAICTGGVIPTLTATGTNIKWYSDAALTTQVGTGNSFTPSISNATAGSFVFYATQTTGSCQSAATAVTITINPSPATPTISGTLTFCAGSNTILTSSSSTGNQWLLNGSPIAGATNQTLTVSAAGDYSVQVTSSGCAATSAAVTVTQSTLAATLATTNPGCSSPSSGVITITATGGTSPYSYSLDGSNFSNTSGVFGGLTAGNYTIYIKDAAGCTITRTQTLNAVSGITAATITSANETDCSKADGTITVSGITGGTAPYEYYINGAANPAGINNNVFAGLTPASYVVRVVSANGCDFVTTMVVGTNCVSCTLTASVSAQVNPTCKGNDGSITLTSANGTGTVSYSIDGGTNFNTNPVFSGLAAGTYTIVVKDANNCIVNAGTVTLTPAVAITATVTGSNPSTCGVNDGTITVSNVTGGSGTYQYSLDGVNYQTSNTFTGLAGNSYTVSIRDASNCVVTYTQVITAPNGISSVTVNTTSETSCSTVDGTITVTATGGTTPYKYYINGAPNPAGIGNNVFTGLAGGVYSIRVETANNCFFVTTASVGTNCTTPCTLVATTTVTDILCNNGSNGQIIASASGGTGLYEYSLDGTTFQSTAIFTNLTPGVYTVTTRDKNNPSCKVTSSVTLTNPPAITGSVTASANPSCQNNDGSITVSASGGTGALQYALNGGAYTNNNSFTGLAAGSYSISAKDANGCITTIGSVTLTLPAAITASTSKTDPTTCSASDGQIIVSNVQNGTGPFQYAINGGSFQTSATFAGLAEGTYTIQVKDAAGCVATLTPVTLKVNVVLAATVTSTNPTSCTAFDGTITVTNPTGGAAPYQYSIDGITFQASNIFTNLAQNTYVVIIKDANGCTQSLPLVTITAPNSITAIALSATDETTCAANDGTIRVTSVTGGTAPYQYFINGVINPAGASNATFSGLAGGIYTIKVVTADGCEFTSTASVTIACCLQASISAQVNPTCKGNDGSITLASTGGSGTIQYSIDNGATFQASANFTGLTAGTYTVVVKDDICQKALGAVTLTAVPLTATVVSTDPSGCSATNGQIVISNVSGGTGSYTYSLDGVTYVSTATFANLSSGSYTVFVQDASGCVISFNRTLASTGGILSVQTTTVAESNCNTRDGQITVVNVTGIAGPYEYYIDGVANPAGINTSTFTGLTSGPHTVRVVAPNTCDFTVSVVIGSNCTNTCTLTASIGSQVDPTCAGNDGSISVSATNGTGTLQYSIDGGTTFVTTNVFTNLSAGTYTILVKDGAGCQTSVSATLTLPATITATLTAGNATSCTVGDGSIAITNVTGGSGSYQYSLDNVTFQATASFTGLTAGSYTVFIKDAAGCSASFTQTITAPSGITATVATSNETACAANDGQVAVTVSGATGVVEYYINGAANPAGINNNAFVGLAPGTYTIRVKDATGCQFTVAATVTAFTCTGCTLTASATEVQPTCAAPNGGSITVTPANGTAPYEYSVNGAAFATGTGQFTGLTAGDYTIQVKDANGCIYDIPTLRLFLPVGPTNMTIRTTNPTSCTATDGVINVTNVASGTVPYQYSINGGIFRARTQFTGLAAGTYTITVRDGKGCTLSKSVTLTAPGGITATAATTNETACNADNGQIAVTVTGATGVVEYYINGVANPAGINTNTFTALTPGAYTILVKDATGCQFTVAATVTAFTCPVCTLTASVSSQVDPTCAGNDGSISVSATNGTGTLQYSIDGGTTFVTTNVFTNLSAGTYTILVKDGAGCQTSVSATLTLPATITATVTPTNPTSCTSNNGSITIGSVVGGDGNYQYSLDGINYQSQPVFGSLSGGNYTVFIKDGANCSITISQILAAPGGITATATVTNETACAANDGQVRVNVSGATGAVEYYINGAANPAGINNNTFTGLVPGTYTILVKDAADCEFVVTTTITVFTCTGCTLTASAAPVQPTCAAPNGGSITVTPANGTAPYEYSVNGAAFAAGTGVFSTLTSGTYTIVVRDAKGCTFNVPAIVLNNPSLTLTVSTTNPTGCGVDDATLTATVNGGTAPYAYSLDGINFSGGSGVFTGLAAGSYTIFVQDAVGCVTNQSVTIATPNGITALTLNPTSETGCGKIDGTIAVTGITGAVGPYEYYINGVANPAGINTNAFTGLAPATYTIRVVAANGCEFVSSTTIATVCTTCQLTATISSANPTSCNTTDGSITISNETNGVAPYQYSIDGVTFQAQPTFTGLADGSYTVVVKDANNCTYSQIVALTAPVGFTATLVTTDETACKSNDGTITVTVNGGVAPYKYYLNGVQNLAGNVFSAVTPGTYTIRITDANNCEYTAVATVKTFTCPPPTCTLTASAFTNPVLCNGVNDGEAILINVSGGSGSYEYSIDNGKTYQANPQFTSLGAGNYTIFVRDKNNLTCFASFPVTVATKFNVAGIIIVNQPKSCGDKGTITFTNVFGGQAPYQFSIDGTTFASDTVFANLNPGTYKATIRDSKGCQFSASIQVIGGAAITATVAQGQQASCGKSDGTIVISNVSGGSGVFVYSLDGTTFGGSTTFANLAAGSYTVYIKEQNGSCVATFPAVVTAAECCKLALTPTATQPTGCASKDGRITINATDGVAPLTYRLNNGAAQNSNVFSGLGNGVYTILVTDANNCTATVTVTLTSPNAVTAQSEQVTPASCFGKADGAVRLINVTGGSGSYEYSIDGVTYQSSELFTGLKANTYLLYVRDKVSACVASYPVTVSEATQVTATVTPTNPSVCTTKDGRIVISNIAGGVGPYQVSMDSLTNYQLTPQFSNLGNGSYKIYIKDSRGCMAVYTLRLSSPNAVTAGNPTLINPTCQGSNNGEIRMTNVTGGQAPYSYNIDGGAYQSSGTFTALSAGKHIINVKDQSGCEYPFEYTLTEPATITFDVKQTKEATCTDPLGSVEVQNPVGGVLPYRYSLNNIDFQTSPIFENLTPGDYVMYVRDASKNTCASTKPFTIRGTKRVTYSVTTANIGCSGTEKGSITIHTIRGGIESGSPVEYGISINGGKSYRYISSDSTVFDNLDAGLYDIIIEYGSGCRTDAQRVIINAGSIPFTVTTSAATCGTNNGSAEVVIANPIPGKTYYYSMDSLNFFTTPIFPNLYSGTYKMYVRESLTDQCPNIQAFTVPGPDSVRYVIRRQDCNTVIVDSIRGGVAPYVITISGRKAIITGDIFANRYVFTDLPDGEYSLTIDDNAGCSTLPFNFRVGNRISYKVKTTPSIAEEPTGGVMVYDITGGQAPYEVSVDGQNWSVIKDKSIPIDTVVNGLPLGLLKVYVRDANGCMVVQDAEIRELKFVVPNVFTPNGDGVNDTFFITKLPAGTFVKIIDRWGRVVFETRDYKNEWDGGMYPDGIYYYTIDIAGEQTYKGWVQIWR